MPTPCAGPQLPYLALQRLHPRPLIRRQAWALALITLGPPHPQPKRLGRAPDLPGNRPDRRPLRTVSVLMLQHHPYRPIPDFRGVLHWLVHDSILSRVGASRNPGAVHRCPDAQVWPEEQAAPPGSICPCTIEQQRCRRHCLQRYAPHTPASAFDSPLPDACAFNAHQRDRRLAQPQGAIFQHVAGSDSATDQIDAGHPILASRRRQFPLQADARRAGWKLGNW